MTKLNTSAYVTKITYCEKMLTLDYLNVTCTTVFVSAYTFTGLIKVLMREGVCIIGYVEEFPYVTGGSLP